MAVTNLPASGRVGAVPPPDAPMEPTQPLQGDAGAIVEYARDPETRTVLLDGAGRPYPTGNVITPAALARQNERELAPLKPAGDQTPATVQPGVKEASHVVQAPRTVVAASEPPHQRPADPTRPAMSMDDDPVNARPARGIPGTAYSAHRSKDPLEVTGGFGGDGEYFALDGTEVAETIRQLMDELAPQLSSDLRFGLAASYPRYAVKLVVTVEAEASDQSFTIEMVRAKEAIPEEIAEKHCDKIVFVLKRERREFDDAGEVQTPPDALREELGLQIPGRRVVSQGKFGPLMADVPIGF